MKKLNHLFIIPDGNRRYARREYLKDLFQNLKKFKSALQELPEENISALERRIKSYIKTGEDPFYKYDLDDFLDSNKIYLPSIYLLHSYRRGKDIFYSLLKWILRNNITKILSIYALQKRNFDRPDEQLHSVLKAESELCEILSNDKEVVSQCKFKFVGDQELFKLHKHRGLLKDVIKKFVNNYKALEEKSSGKKLRIYILTPYDSIWEINQAIVNNKFDPTKLIVKEPVDLILRAGGGKTHISGGLPIQTAFSPFISTKEYFPDFSVEIFQKILNEYKPKKRESGL